MTGWRRAVTIAAVAIPAMFIAAIGAAQFRRGGRFAAVPIATAGDFDGSFMFCRIAFRQNPYGDGDGWSVDYPRADLNLSFRLSELTKTSVSRDETGEFKHVVLRLTDPLLFHCPFVMLTEPGGSFFDEMEAERLREYVLKGGFLWVDDFWGPDAWRNWSEQIAKALPPGQYPINDLPLDHSIFHTLYSVTHVPQIPSIGFWMRGGRTSERGPLSADPHVRAIVDGRGRILVLMTFNTDFGDAFEREGDDHEYFLRFAPDGYAFGINAIVYALSH